MAYLKPASECLCGTCPGRNPPTPEPHFYGGWVCDCPCHSGGKKPEVKFTPVAITIIKSAAEAATIPCPRCGSANAGGLCVDCQRDDHYT